MKSCAFFTAFLLTTMATPSISQDLSFQFVSPTFGGSSFNSGHLLALADIQNQHTEDGSTQSSTGSSQSDLFVRQLQSRLLSSLSSGLSEVITGAEPGDTDTIVIGDQQIFYERSLEDIRVQITNLLDGSSTEILLPVVDGSQLAN
ncbi:curli assembly protein CsgF [Sulfitobacter noctilucicola]|uniref:Curli production assembly/transport component CsgF n=1 Tax=Sulfitobacter noctilucicola TaxID=1342301 RepID=A0A7W6Q6R2_9RHOB|nr:curli assembly protein CsgF [Sulfitobacter noctilucicola]MBB4175087.1 curli production assembly/transport component CsgF [Sulfitobacter noctilucicola]